MASPKMATPAIREGEGGRHIERIDGRLDPDLNVAVPW
jgi:hypothetical protein